MKIANLDELINNATSITVIRPNGKPTEVYNKEKGVLSDPGMEYVIHTMEQVITHLSAIV